MPSEGWSGQAALPSINKAGASQAHGAPKYVVCNADGSGAPSKTGFCWRRPAFLDGRLLPPRHRRSPGYIYICDLRAAILKPLQEARQVALGRYL
jgi:hypothetical protein